MSADPKPKKRKSGDDIVHSAKKVKTTKSADRPAPLKSALKSKVETVEKKAKSKKSKIPEAVVVTEQSETIVSDDGEPGGAELTADQTAALLAGFSSDEGSEDEGGGIDIAKLPAAPTTGDVQNTIANATADKNAEHSPGVVYLSRIPHGFFETQMRAYFAQFGTISRLRLARSRKTGKSQHHAFVEFDSAAVADIVAKTMDKYLLFGHILQCRRVPAEQVQEGMFKGPKAVRQGGKVRPRNRIEGTRLRKGMEREQWERRISREEKRRIEKAEKLKEMGYEFEMPPVRSVADVQVGKTPEGVIDDTKADDSIKLIEGKKKEIAPGDEKEVVKLVTTGTGSEVSVEKTTKRKNKTAGATTTTKKRKTKAV